MQKYLILFIAFLLFTSCGTENTPTYRVNIDTTPFEGGEISITPDGNIHEEGTKITLTPQSADGFLFSQWQGDYTSTSNPLTFTLNNDVTVTGVFEKRSYPLNITTEGEGNVTEQIVQQKTDYEYGTVVELTANPSSGWEFNGWSGDITRTDNPTQLTIESEITVTANFVIKIKETFGGSGYDEGRFIAETSDGGYIITGRTESIDGDFNGLNNGGEDILVLKVDSYGGKQWIKTAGGSGSDRAHSLTPTSDGGYIIVGSFTSNDGDFNGMNSGNHDVFVLKMDSNGNQQWIKTVGGSRYEAGYSISQTNDGGYAITGHSESNDGDFSGLNKGASDVFILKMDSNGNQQWIKTVGGSGSDIALSITQTSDGGYIVTGYSESNDGDFNGLNLGAYDVITLKVDSNGNQQWIKTFAGRGNDFARSLISTSDGGYIITGSSDSNDGDFDGLNKGDYDGFILKMDSNGNHQWTQTVGGGGSDRANSITTTSDGGYIITGSFYSNTGDFNGLNIGMEDIYVLKVDSNGNQLWIKALGGSESDFGTSIVNTTYSGYIITGLSNSTDGDFNGLNKGGTDLFLIKN